MKLFALIASLFTTIAASVIGPTQPSRSVTGQGRKLTILYTASAKGQIRSCNCTKFRYGGYGREITLVKSIRQACPDAILIEGGDCVEWVNPQSDLKTEVTIKAMKLIRYEAMIPGEDELGRHGSRIADRFKAEAIPVICANITKDGSVELAYAPYSIIKTRSGLKVGLIGLVDPSVGRLFQRNDLDKIITDPQKALRLSIIKLGGLVDAVVVVYHGPVESAEKLATVKGVNVIIATHRTTREVIFPEDPNNEVSAPIKQIGDVVLVNSETKTNWCLGRIDLNISKDRKAVGATHKLIYLDRRYDEDPQMVEIYESYNERVKQAVLTESSELKKSMSAFITNKGLSIDDMRKRLHVSPFATSEKCKTCHSKEAENWSQSRHAKAMTTLASTHQDYDPECIGCHATGVSVRDGFSNMKDTPELGGVQCEACHGPGLKHTQAPAKGYGKVDEQTCRSCHTEERTPEFDFQTSREKIKH